MTDLTDKVEENRLRRVAARQGLRLVKSRRRDPRTSDYGTYMLLDAETNAVVQGEAAALDLIVRSTEVLDDPVVSTGVQEFAVLLEVEGAFTGMSWPDVTSRSEEALTAFEDFRPCLNRRRTARRTYWCASSHLGLRCGSGSALESGNPGGVGH
jgi:hypothetical protein